MRTTEQFEAEVFSAVKAKKIKIKKQRIATISTAACLCVCLSVSVFALSDIGKEKINDSGTKGEQQVQEAPSTPEDSDISEGVEQGTSAGATADSANKSEMQGALNNSAPDENKGDFRDIFTVTDAELAKRVYEIACGDESEKEIKSISAFKAGINIRIEVIYKDGNAESFLLDKPNEALGKISKVLEESEDK
ncbi:MAG: hypothetical protein IJ408_02175 [Clostridia bacterium]|nr:hypothetical protein [Clostridia bacterium]